MGTFMRGWVPNAQKVQDRRNWGSPKMPTFWAPRDRTYMGTITGPVVCAHILPKRASPFFDVTMKAVVLSLRLRR